MPIILLVGGMLDGECTQVEDASDEMRYKLLPSVGRPTVGSQLRDVVYRKTGKQNAFGHWLYVPATP